MRRPGLLADAAPLDWGGPPGLINAPVPIAIQMEKFKKRREIEKIHNKRREIEKIRNQLRLQSVLPPPALGIPTEHLVIGGLLAILLLRKDGLPIDNLLLPLAGVGAFLWYKNKTKEIQLPKEIRKLPFEANQRPIGPFMPTVSNGHIGPFMPTVSNGHIGPFMPTVSNGHGIPGITDQLETWC